MKTYFVLVWMIVHAVMALAQSPGTFTPTGSMTTWRIFHTATLLNDGRVLIAGGRVDNQSGLVSAELYDPSTGTFTATGNMTAPRNGHTATLLPNGKVLIAGGNTGSARSPSPLASAELYDPSTGSFTPIGAMAATRSFHTATLLNNGKVLLAGGNPGAQGTAELFDASTGSFTPTGNMTVARIYHRATLLANGTVLIVPDAEGAVSAELYDPGSGSFRPTGWVSQYLDASTANLLLDGTILVTLAPPECDYNGADAQTYDPGSETFSATGKMVKGRCLQTGTSLSDGTVLISGVWSCTDAASTELYDPASGGFTQTVNMTIGRYAHTATLLKDGRVLVAGGLGVQNTPCGNTYPAAAEIYNPRSVAPPPALLSLSGDGQGAGAILHASTHQIVSPGNPAVAGEALEIYLTGLIDGSVIPPQVAVGRRLAEVLFFGKAPGYSGLNQINVRVPTGVTPGPTVPVRLNYLSRPSNEVMIGVE